jgi:hypothetical protein
MAAPPAGAAAEQQLAHLLAAKQLREDVLRRQPAREVRSAKGEKHGSLVHKESGGHLCMSIVGHPNEQDSRFTMTRQIVPKRARRFAY